MDIIKPDNEDRIIKYEVLPNKLKCISVYSKNINKSYIVACVNIGSLANKEYYDGIAHLLEHMCFIISKKYNQKNYIQTKATEYGGYTNAYTDDLNTVYFFEIFTKNLEQMVEIFSDYLFNSELNEAYINDEIKNVDSEHRKNINNDHFKLFHLEHLLADKKTNFNGFFTGSIDTLNKKDIKEKLINFYKKYYIPENISICIVSNLKNDKIMSIIKKNFSKINCNLKLSKVIVNKPIYKNNKNKTFLMQSINEIYIFKYIFETDTNNKYLKTKVFDLFSYFINTNQKNSLKDFLKINNFIINLWCNYDHSNGLLTIQFELTKKGFKNIEKIDGYLKYYVINILNNINFKDSFKNVKKLQDFILNNSELTDSISLAELLTINSFIYEPKNIYIGNFLLLEFNEQHIIDLKKFINFNNCLQIIVSHNFNEKNYLVDPYYQTKYSEIKKINSDPLKFNFDITFINNYLNSKPKFIKELNNEVISEINKNIWFGNSSKFKEKIIYVKIIFNNNNFFSTVKNYNLSHIAIDVLTFILKRELNEALELKYNFGFDLSVKTNQIILNLSLLNDINYSQKFIDRILEILFLFNITISNKIINQIIQNFKNDLINIKNLSPWDYINYIQNLNYENEYEYEILINELNNINLSDIINYIQNCIKKSYCITCTFGNINKNFNFNLLKNTLNNKYKFPQFNIVPLIKILHPNKNEKNNCIKINYIIGKYNEKLYLHLLITSLILHDFFFNKIRTDKQLGYLVVLDWSKVDHTYILYQKVQSSFNLEFVEKTINEFNDNILEYIKDIDIKFWIETLKEHLKKKEANLYELANKNFSEIINREFIFNRNQLLLKKIKGITSKSINDFIIKYIIKNKDKSIIKLYGHK